MFKKYNFSTGVKDQDEINIFKNIRRSGIFILASCDFVFHFIDAINWILKNIDLRNIYVCHSIKEPITLFRPEYLERFYHLEKGTTKLDRKLLDKFENIVKELFPKWYKSDRKLKLTPRGGVPVGHNYIIVIFIK